MPCGTGLGLAAADVAVGAVLAGVFGALANGDTVRLAGFGTFAANDRSARAARNPRTGENIAVSALRSMLFRAGKGLRNAVNRTTG